MNFSEDDRGVSELIGFILLFGFLIILMSIWQAQVVPAENSKKEFKHYIGVQEDVSELRSDYIETAGTGNTRSATVKLGTTYPTRIFFVSAPPPRGRINTEMPSDGTITADGFNISQVCGLNSPVKTRSVTFDTEYNHMSNAEAPPYVLENTVLYKQTPGGTVLFESDQSLVQGATLNIYPLTNNMSRSGIEATSIRLNGAEIGNTEVSGSLSVTIPTTLSDEQWERLLKDQPNFDSTQQIGSQRVKIVLSDASWNIQCGVVGAEQTPDVTNPSQINSRSNGNTGVGGGAVSNYSENSNSDTFFSTNGRWTGVTCTDQLLLSAGQPASKPNGNNFQGNVIRLTTLLNDSTGESYTIDIKIARAADGSWNNKEVVIYDSNGNSFNAKLTPTAAREIYHHGETNILELSKYNDPDTGSGSFSDFVKRVRALENDAPVTWQTSRMTGRVRVALECDSPPASKITMVDGTTPSSGSPVLQFDIQAAPGTVTTVTDITVTTPGNQNTNVQSATQFRRTSSGDEVRLTASNTDGVNRSGSLRQNIKLDGTEYELDTKAVFSDGAVLSVDMGEVDGGSTDWTYSLADSKSEADVVVTFLFENGTQFQAYLRVTNVNS